jgi:phospholipase/carboxylesterase
MRRLLATTLVAMTPALLCGCFPGVPDTPYQSLHAREPKTGAAYTFYVPSFYSKDRDWPLVIPLHGTYGFDSPDMQVQAWKDQAEKHGLIVAAPALESVQGILPVPGGVRQKELEADERIILAVIDDISSKYRIDRQSVMMTGFSAGGYPLYFVGLRNPTKFQILIAGAANSSKEIFDQIKVTPEVRDLRVAVFWGRDDMKIIQDESWQAFAWLRTNKCYKYLPERHKM